MGFLGFSIGAYLSSAAPRGGADTEHGGVKAPEMTAYPEFFERVAAFFRKSLPSR